MDRVSAAEGGFPFGMEMTLEAARLPGSKRVPDLDIGDHGEVVLELSGARAARVSSRSRATP
jgi:hypothetical protein